MRRHAKAPSSRSTTRQGSRRGDIVRGVLLVNSTNVCRGTHRAIAEFEGHNGKVRDIKPILKAKCGKARKASKKARGGR